MKPFNALVSIRIGSAAQRAGQDPEFPVKLEHLEFNSLCTSVSSVDRFFKGSSPETVARPQRGDYAVIDELRYVAVQARDFLDQA